MAAGHIFSHEALKDMGSIDFLEHLEFADTFMDNFPHKLLTAIIFKFSQHNKTTISIQYFKDSRDSFFIFALKYLFSNFISHHNKIFIRFNISIIFFKYIPN